MCTACAPFVGQLLHAQGWHCAQPWLILTSLRANVFVRNLLPMILPHTPDTLCRPHIAFAAFLPCICQYLFHPCHCLYFVSHSFALAIETLCHHSALPHFSLYLALPQSELSVPLSLARMPLHAAPNLSALLRQAFAKLVLPVPRLWPILVPLTMFLVHCPA